MSECVVRMEMPSGCHDCKLRNMVGNCPIPMFDGQDEKKIWTLEECFQRPPWCPIVCSLPEGHGRLVDADVLLKFMYEYDDYEGAKEAHDLDLIHRDSICYAIEEAPTIVPSEAERSET